MRGEKEKKKKVRFAAAHLQTPHGLGVPEVIVGLTDPLRRQCKFCLREREECL
jgi:hypothetical protein